MSFRPKKTVKSGRRAHQPIDEPVENADDIIPEASPQKSSNKQQITKGWGEDSFNQKRVSQSKNSNKEETILNKDADSDSDREMNIPTIPEASNEEPQIAQAPNVMVNRVSTYKELDRDLSEHVAFTVFEDEIDLKILSNCLMLKSEVEEDDEQWEYDHLFAEVTSDLIGDFSKQIS